MKRVLSKWKSRDFLLVLLFLQLTLYATVFFDVPVARQVIGLIYLYFVPGFVITKLLKLDELDELETILFSVALSVAFLMLAGLLINEFGFVLGFSKPLSLMPLMIILNSLVLVGGVLIYVRSEAVKLFRVHVLRLLPLALILISLPILSILGAMWVNVYEGNYVLLFMITAIALLFVVGVISKKAFPHKLYPLAILMFAISLLYHSSLISNYLVSFGSDNSLEYFVFKIAESNGHWSSVFMYPWDPGYGRINSMLSVTILPTIYSSLLNIDATGVFKIIYPLIFSFIPLALYKQWQENLGEKRAFMASFLCMVQNTFYTEMLGLTRQMIAELFFVLLLLVVLNKKMKHLNKMTFFMIFSFGLVTSHYALAEIFLFFISFALIPLIILKRPSKNITVSMVAFFFVVMFTWYIYTSGSSVFNSFLQFGDNIYRQLGEFSNPASRGQTVLRALGMEEAPSIWNSISRAFAYITQALIVIGFVGFALKRTKIFEMDYFILSSEAVALLAALVLVPGLANTLNMTRFYHILLFFLAPLCVLGAEFLVKLVSKRRIEILASILLLIVLVPYFLFQTGFVYEVTGSESWSLPLSKHRMNGIFLHLSIGYFNECEVFGALWMSKNMDVENSKTYADRPSLFNVLTSYGMIYRGSMEMLSNVTMLSSSQYVYLDQANIIDGIMMGSNLWNTTDISDIWGFADKIYSNSGCEIYKEKIGS